MPVLATVGGASSRGFGEFRPASASGSFIVATGGTTADSGNYRYHTFNSSGTFAVSAWPSGKYVDFLVVGGGGAGGDVGGGGGGVVIKESISGSVGSYAVTIGDGATNLGGVASLRTGQNSSFLGYVGLGGGGGDFLAFSPYGGAAGGSGGGAVPAGSGGAALQPTSAYGGYGNVGAGSIGGGGGAGAAASGTVGGAGISGSPLSSSLYGAGGDGNDGTGATVGAANTGNGGHRDAGGSGIVIIRYLFQ